MNTEADFGSLKLQRNCFRAFTLIELLAVMAVMLVMLALLVPSLTGIKGAGDLTKAAYDISGTLEQARAYAMANNTFVFVGFEEVDSTQPDSAKPQKDAAGGVGGRVAVAVVASRDGTRSYDVTNGGLSNPAWTNYNNGSNLVAIYKLQRFENLHMAQLFSTLPNSGGLSRPTISSANYMMGNTAVDSCVTPFDWPLGNAIGSGQYSFKRVINFDPQGVARIQYKANTDTIVQDMEIGLQQTHGNAVVSGSNAAAIQVDGMTGATRIYRP